MKVYVDLVLFINFILDLLLLIGVSIILKRNKKTFRLLLGAFIGSLSMFSLFLSINSFTLFLIKVVISIIMVLVSFGYKNIKYTLSNIAYLYLLSIVLGGALYFVNNTFSYKSLGFLFINNGFSINLVLVILLSPIIIFLYIKKVKEEKEVLSKKYNVIITLLNGKKLNLSAFLDTGNNLYDPYKKRPIIVINKRVLKSYNPRCILVPCHTVNNKSLLKCFKIKELIINGKKIEEELLACISDNNFNMGDVDLLLHSKIIRKGDINEKNY